MHPILVIDDEEPMRSMLRQMIGAMGYPVLLAKSAEEGMLAAATHSLALVISDIRLPGTNGLDLLGQLRAIPGHRDTPVIAMTGYYLPEGLPPGFAGFLEKPFTGQQLREAIRTALDGHGS